MTLTQPAGDPPEPVRDGADAAGVRSVPAAPGDGEKLGELPPLVEFAEFADAAVRPNGGLTRLSGPGPRPVRRRFLAPVLDVDAVPLPMPAIRRDARSPPEVLAQEPPSAEPRDPPTDPQTDALQPRGPPNRATLGKPLRWRRNLAVTVGIVTALALSVAFEAGIGPDRLSAIATAVWQRLAGAPAPSGPPANPAQLATYYTGHATAGDPDAQLALAILYAKGAGVKQDYAAAAQWFRAAAGNGVLRAQYDLGVLYEHGRGVPLDYQQAVVWYRKAAERNHPLAQYNLAVAFTKGQGVARDFAAAVLWYRRAAAQGVTAAMVNLAILYERGDGIELSPVDAYAWYHAAAARGSAVAAQRGEELLQALPPADQSRAEARTAEIAAEIHELPGEQRPSAAGVASSTVSPVASAQQAPRDADTGAESPQAVENSQPQPMVQR